MRAAPAFAAEPLVIIHKKWTEPVALRSAEASTISATEKFGRLFLTIHSGHQAAARWAPRWRLRSRPLRTKVFCSVFACPAGSAPPDRLSSPLPVFHQVVAAPEKIFSFLVVCTSVCHTLRHSGNIFNRAIPHWARRAPANRRQSRSGMPGGSSSGWHNSTCPSRRSHCRAPVQWDTPAQYHTIRGGTEP